MNELVQETVKEGDWPELPEFLKRVQNKEGSEEEQEEKKEPSSD